MVADRLLVALLGVQSATQAYLLFRAGRGAQQPEAPQLPQQAQPGAQWHLEVQPGQVHQRAVQVALHLQLARHVRAGQAQVAGRGRDIGQRAR